MASFWNFDRMVNVFVALCAGTSLGYIIWDHFPQAQRSQLNAPAVVWWPWVLIGLCVIVTVIQAIRLVILKTTIRIPAKATVLRELSNIEQRFPTDHWDDTLRREFRRKFVNETIHIDGREFAECVFENVTFQFHGTRQCRFINCTFDGLVNNAAKVKFTSDNPVVGQTMLMLNELGLLQSKADYELRSSSAED